MPCERSDGELLCAARGGDQGAWNTLVQRLTPRLFGVARAYGLSRNDASDVCQVAWLRLLSHVDEIRDPGRVAAWLSTTVRHECLRHLRLAGRQLPIAGDDQVFDTDAERQPEVDADLLRTERQVVLAHALSQLPANCQRILRVLMIEPRPTYDEVATALGVPIGTLGPTRGRCLKLLRHKLGGISDDSDGSPS